MIVQMVFRLNDGFLDAGFEHRPDSFEHQVECRQLARFMIAYSNRHLLKDAQHGTLPDRAVSAFEGVVQRQVLNGRLEQRKLVRNERVTVNEVIPVPKIPVGMGAVGEVEQRPEVVGLGRVEFGEHTEALFGFRQQALPDDFVDVGARQMHPDGEPVLNLREVIADLFVHLADDRSHLFLGRHDNPGATAAFGRQAFGDGLKVGHQSGVSGDILPHFIDEEIQTKAWRLPLDIFGNLSGEVFDGDVVLAAIPSQYPDRLRTVASRC